MVVLFRPTRCGGICPVDSQHFKLAKTIDADDSFGHRLGHCHRQWRTNNASIALFGHQVFVFRYHSWCYIAMFLSGCLKNMEWNGMMEWNAGMECWNGMIEWNDGMEWWNGMMEWNDDGMLMNSWFHCYVELFRFIHILSAFHHIPSSFHHTIPYFSSSRFLSVWLSVKQQVCLNPNLITRGFKRL